MSSIIANINTLITEQLGDVIPTTGSALSTNVGDTSSLSSFHTNIEAAGLLLYLNELANTYPNASGSLTSGALRQILAHLHTLLSGLNAQDLSPTLKQELSAFQSTYSTAYQQSKQQKGYASVSWSIFANDWASQESCATRATNITNDITNQINAQGGIQSLPTSGNGQDATFIFAVSMIAANATQAPYSSEYFSTQITSLDNNNALELFASGAANFLEEQNLASAALMAPLTFNQNSNDTPFLTSLQNDLTNPSAIISESTVNMDVQELFAYFSPTAAPGSYQADAISLEQGLIGIIQPLMNGNYDREADQLCGLCLSAESILNSADSQQNGNLTSWQLRQLEGYFNTLQIIINNPKTPQVIQSAAGDIQWTIGGVTGQ